MKFTKMHGLGNDYLFINCFEEKVSDPEALAIAMSDRHCGAGADGIILVLPSDVADFRMRIFNADGSEAEICGNGIRCFAKYVYERGLTDKKSVCIQTLAGLKEIDLKVDGERVNSVRVCMGTPRFLREEIPMLGDPGTEVIEEPIEIDGQTLRISCVSMGNPHAVVFVDDVTSVPLEVLGPKIETHELFPERINVEFVQVLDRQNLSMRVWERGSGVTLACGSGTCASAVIANVTDRAERKVTVHLPKGTLEVEWAEDENVYMEGPAADVYEGEWPDQW